MYPFYRAPTTLDEALALKAELGAGARVLAGGTDLLIELDRGARTTPQGDPPGVIDLTRVPGLADITLDVDPKTGREIIRLGALVTHNQCAASDLIGSRAFALARACWEVGAPQIRNRATLAGNIITASPANDTIAPLLALDARVTLRSAARGARILPLADFITGFRSVDLADDEILTAVDFPAPPATQRGLFIKLGLRRAQAISVLNVAVVLDQPAGHHGPVERARIALGAVAPTVIRATAAEDVLTGTPLADASIQAAAQLATEAAQPIDDIRGSAGYRRHMVGALVSRALRQLARGAERDGWPGRPVTLWGVGDGRWPVAAQETATDAGSAEVNGQPVALPGGMTLLDSLRAAGFVGVKEGCAEGECGACTVFLDGMAVMACLVPAERAAGSRVVTVEGLGVPAALHPVQEALVQSGGVQCGYCTPGFVMSAAKLLEERPRPTRGEAQEALTGNLCRCTGYRKILDAVVQAGVINRDRAAAL